MAERTKFTLLIVGRSGHAQDPLGARGRQKRQTAGPKRAEKETCNTHLVFTISITMYHAALS